jgi:hypothetical protein
MDNQVRKFEFETDIDDKDLDNLFDDTVTLEERVSRNRAYTRSKKPPVRRFQTKMSSDLASLFKQRIHGGDSTSDSNTSDSQSVQTKLFELKPNRAQTIKAGIEDKNLNEIPEERSQESEDKSMMRQKPMIKQAKTTKFELRNFENISDFSWSSESSIEKNMMSAGTQEN